MRPRPSVTTAVVLALIAALVAGTLALFSPDHRALGGAIFVLACLGLLVVRRLRPELFEARERVVVDAWGVRRLVGPRQTEALAWGELVRVTITTTAAGPGTGLYVLLHGADGRGVAVAQRLALQVELLPLLQRLPGFDHEVVARAARSTEVASFLCWEGSAGAGDRLAASLREGAGAAGPQER